MLIQLTTPRVVFDLSRHQPYIYIHTLSKPEVSNGKVRFTGPTDPEHGQHGTVVVGPKEALPLEGGLCVKVHVLPFWKLFQGGPKTAMHDGAMVRAADLKLTRFCTAGFQVSAKSAFRAAPGTYEEHQVAFTMVFPVTGGGTLRLADSLVDLTNPSFDPWACDPNPLPEAAKAELRDAYARVHVLPSGRSDIEARRRARITAAEASMQNARKTPTRPDGPMPRLPPKE